MTYRYEVRGVRPAGLTHKDGQPFSYRTRAHSPADAERICRGMIPGCIIHCTVAL